MIDAILSPVIGGLKWLGGLLFKEHAASRARTREHDVALFKKGDETINETFLDQLLNSDLYNHWCFIGDITSVGRFCANFQREENQFLDLKVRTAATETIRALSAVNDFVGRHFFRSDVPNDTDRLVLHRELRESSDDETRARYWGLAAELNALIDAASEAYRRYRATVRKRLIV